MGKKDDPSSHFRWTYLDREIQIASPSQDTVSIRYDGTVKILVNTYHTGTTVDSVKYGTWAKGFNWTTSLEKDRWKHMKQKSDWSWKAAFQPGEAGSFELVVNAFLADGQVLHRKKKFVTGQRLEDNQVDGCWHNLAGNKEHNPLVHENHELPYKLEWTANAGSNIFMSSPVLHNNYVLSSTFDDGEAADCHIFCWNASTGEEVWRHKTRNGVKTQMVIAKGLLIATDMEGITYALEVETVSSYGKKIWNTIACPALCLAW